MKDLRAEIDALLRGYFLASTTSLDESFHERKIAQFLALYETRLQGLKEKVVDMPQGVIPPPQVERVRSVVLRQDVLALIDQELKSVKGEKVE